MLLRHIRIPVLLLCLLLAGGCSMMRAGYNHFDSAAGWIANDYFDLHADQRDLFAQRFQRLHNWHRQTQLSDYIQFLTEMQTRTKRGLRESDIVWLIDGVKQRYARIAVRAAPDAAELLATLTPEQIDHFRQQLDKSNKKFIQEHRINGSEAERRKVVQERTLKQLREWVGPLSEPQQAKIAAILQTAPLIEKLRHEDRLRRQREFFALLELRKGDRSVFAQKLRDWLENWESGRSPEQTRQFDESWKKRAELYAALDPLMTPAQRNHLVGKLQEYIDNFRHLSAPAPAP